MNNQWLNDLHRKMEDHEEDIPDGLWEDIKDELFSEEEENGMAGAMMLGADDEKENINPSVTSRKSLWYRVGGIAAAIAMLFFTGKLLLDMNAEKSGPQITKRAENVDDSTLTGKKTTDPVTADTNDKTKTSEVEKYGHVGNILTDKASFKEILKNVLGQRLDYDKVISGSHEKEKGVELLTKETQPTNIFPSTNENPVLKDKKEVEEIFNKTENELHEKMAATEKPKPSGRQSKNWMLSMLTGNVSSNSSDQKFPGYASISGSPMTFSDVFMSGTEADPLTEVLLANQSKEVEARIRHKIPVTFGLSMYYNIGKRWGIGTGVSYTKLTSELHSGSNSNYIKGEQSIHYIGIPVQVNYNVIQKGRFTGYVTGGVLAEKAVAGKLRTKYIVNDEVTETQDERLDVKPVQFSVSSAVGLQVKIIDKIGIYAEPGIGYHFKNDSQLNTIYKEKPLNFNMKFGIRLLLD
ncbi:outer membrane beta-barrel protein [Chryseobacterium sp. OV279]|uniref:outer membrane beta-barrel protein n=1 Tax=Chryseobacterium sp. OV279 TaxID=1500285 RepID=UPI0009195AA0|nr:outer membrane beta-barrel protein [Chryseobacterium sp. OV279]SHG30781.1 Outer membrane protein beta-barrel domain-containing protein [Chryseobacterium sp. OV279]